MILDRRPSSTSSTPCSKSAGPPGARSIVAETVASIKNGAPAVEVCVCLGLLKDGQAERLREAGADAYNHNLNTSAENYADICSTHTFDDRIATVTDAKTAGLSPCSGAIFGMGESNDDIVDVALALRELEPDSVPVNFLIPFKGTPLGERWDLSAALPTDPGDVPVRLPRCRGPPRRRPRDPFAQLATAGPARGELDSSATISLARAKPATTTEP